MALKVYIFSYKRRKKSKAKFKGLVFFEINRGVYHAMKNIEKVKSIRDNYKFDWYTEVSILRYLFQILPFYDNYKNAVKFK